MGEAVFYDKAMQGAFIMYDLIRDIYPRQEDKSSNQLEAMALDSKRRMDMLDRRAKICEELQNVLAEDPYNEDKVREISDKLEDMRRLMW